MRELYTCILLLPSDVDLFKKAWDAMHPDVNLVIGRLVHTTKSAGTHMAVQPKPVKKHAYYQYLGTLTDEMEMLCRALDIEYK